MAAFETDFHATIPDRNRYYAIPYEWAEKGLVRRWGFHGASHRYIATRTAELLGRNDLRIISCHLGGSSSLCAIRNGQSVATSMGMSPQSGTAAQQPRGRFRSLRPAGDHEADRQDARPKCLQIWPARAGCWASAASAATSATSNEAAAKGNARAQLALDVFAASVRHYLGAYLVELGGADVIVFTGGIGENRRRLPRRRLRRTWRNWASCWTRPANARPRARRRSAPPESRVQMWVVPTNEELIVARQVSELLTWQSEG